MGRNNNTVVAITIIIIIVIILLVLWSCNDRCTSNCRTNVCDDERFLIKAAKSSRVEDLNGNQKRLLCETNYKQHDYYKRHDYNRDHIYDAADMCREFHLTQKDFDSGSYRIKHGGIYILEEDIEFQPIPCAEATRTDKPYIGWFAIISVETSQPVKIYLNGHSLKASQEFIDNHIFNVFACIELGNSPFSGDLFYTAGVSYIGDAKPISANNTSIAHGTIGRSGHWCIHGNNNSNIDLYDLCVEDFEVAGIQLNGCIDSCFRKIKVSGLKHEIHQTGTSVAAVSTLEYLRSFQNLDLPSSVKTKANFYADQLQAYMTANPDIFQPTILLPTSNFYGIFFSSGQARAVPFPITNQGCIDAAVLSNGRTNSGLNLEDIVIEDLKNNPIEVILIQGITDGKVMYNTQFLGMPVFGSPSWYDAFDSNGNFNPNPLLQAQVYAVQIHVQYILPVVAGQLSINFPVFASAVLNPNPNSASIKFFASSAPKFGQILDDVSNIGLFGLRLDCTIDSTIKNMEARNLENIGAKGIELSQIPGGQNYPGYIQTRYTGNDIWGYELGNCRNVVISKAHSNDIKTINGDSFGLDLINVNYGIIVEDSKSTNVVGLLDSQNSIVNVSSEGYGFRAMNSQYCEFNRCSAFNVETPRDSFGFASEESDNVIYDHVKVDTVIAVAIDQPKLAVGIHIEQSFNNDIIKPCITNVETPILRD